MQQTKEMRLVYSEFLETYGQQDERIVAVEADLASSMTTNRLSDSLGKRYVNVGIMEQEMIGVAAGLSVLGYKPYIHTFGSFASRRVFDQVFLSLGYAQLGATLIGSDAGVAAEMNGGTHMPFEDLGLMRLIPNAWVYEVCDPVQFHAVLQSTLTTNRLTYIRTIRKAPQVVYQGDEDFSKGYCIVREGSDATIVASGIMVSEALAAAGLLEELGISTQVIDLFRLKPIAADFIEQIVGRPVITAENHNSSGGLGTAVCELLATRGDTPVHRVGVEESFGQVGQQAYLMEQYGLTARHIAEKVQAALR